MKVFLFFTFFVAVVKSGLWICLGVLIKNHFETLLSFILRKPIPENLIEKTNYEAFNKVINWIGIFIIIIGIVSALTAVATTFMGFGLPVHGFNFRP